MAFLDLLGFSRKVQNTWGKAESVLPIILDLKERLRRYSSNPLVIEFESDPGRRFDCVIRSISDSIIVAISIPDPDDIFDVLGAVLTVQAHIWQAISFASERGFAVRGAYDLGPLYWDEDDFIGPAFNSVYRIESKICDVARVVVGPSLLESLATKVPEHLYGLLRNTFYRSGDGLCSFNPADHLLDRYLKFRAESGSSKYKYDEIISVLENPNPEYLPSRSELLDMARSTREKIKRISA